MNNTKFYVVTALTFLFGMIAFQAFTSRKSATSATKIVSPDVERKQEERRLRLKTIPGTPIAGNDDIVVLANKNVTTESKGLNSDYRPTPDFFAKTNDLAGYLVREMGVPEDARGELEKVFEKRNISVRGTKSLAQVISDLQESNLSSNFVKMTTAPIVLRYSELDKYGSSPLINSSALASGIQSIGQSSQPPTEILEISIPIIGKDAQLSTQSLFFTYASGKIVFEQFTKSEGGTFRLKGADAAKIREALKSRR